jgi:hypothetical protein
VNKDGYPWNVEVAQDGLPISLLTPVAKRDVACPPNGFDYFLFFLILLANSV